MDDGGLHVPADCFIHTGHLVFFVVLYQEQVLVDLGVCVKMHRGGTLVHSLKDILMNSCSPH